MFSKNPLFRFLKWRARLVGDLHGDVLEIGVGEGENLPYYRSASQIWAIEPDPPRAAVARQHADKMTIPVTVDIAPAEKLPYAAASFDHVVSSLVFCSVTDQQQALREIRRVLRPGGTLHMIEHIRPDNPMLAWLFHAITPWWRKVAFNCHLDRPTIRTLQEAGWRVQVHRRIAMVVRMSAT